VGDGQPEEGLARRLDGVTGGEFGDRGRVERAGRQHGAFGEGGDRAAEQLVVQRGVEHRHGQQVHRERERVGAEPEAVQPDAPVVQPGGHAAGERPAAVVDRRGLAAVVLVLAEHFLGELADHAAPQTEVVGLVPRGLAGRLEDADRDHLDQAARVRDAGGVTPVQREGRRARHPVVAQRQRADRHGGRAGAQVARVADRGAQALFALLAVRAGQARGGVLVGGRPADVDAVEEPAAGEGEPRAVTGQVGLDQPVGDAVLEDGGLGEIGDHVREAPVPCPVRPLRQQVRRQARDVHHAGRRLRVEFQGDVRQRDGRGRPPRRRREQRRARHPGLRRVLRRGADPQVVPAGVQVGVDAEPLPLTRSEPGALMSDHRVHCARPERHRSDKAA
jgi:hypothetical protein